MAFPQSFLDELTGRCDIVDVVSSYVHLTKKGSNYFGLCPFHNEKTGSFSVSPDKQIYHCFGCKKGGGVINFIMEEENLSFPDAVRFLAGRAGMEVPEDTGDRERDRLRARVLSLNKEAARFFYQNLQSPAGTAVSEYLRRRRITRKTAMDFGLGASLDAWDSLLTAMVGKGYSKTELLAAGLVVQNKQGRLYDKFRNRLIFPVIDVRGDVVGFGGRVLDKSEPKYMNTPETVTYSKRRVLYGMNLAKRTKRPNIILCEGNIDVITLHQAGFDNAVASMGTALTTEQTRILSRYTKELVLCYDNDGAGKNATEKAIELLKNSEFTVRVLQLPNRMVDGQPVKQDVDDFIKNQGRAAFEALLTGSEDQVDYRMETVAAKYDLTDDKQRVAYATEISELIAKLPNAVEREVCAGRAAERTGISREAMLIEVERAGKRLYKKEKRAAERREMNPISQLQPQNRSIRYSDVRSALAEEGVIRLLLRDESLFPHCASLTVEEFSSPLLGKIYGALSERHSGGLPLTIAALSALLTAEEMNHLSALLQKPESLSRAEEALKDYIRIIQDACLRRSGTQETDPLLAAQEKNRKKKGYGGKQV
ncbi:MAG: DNA primase [Oscillospiraceae bacterium]|jgi:DNA primase|nr:DNA primase [Oscillospiraceae bacterium]